MPVSRKEDPLSPLYRQCLFRSNERAAVHDQVSHELIEHLLQWKHGTPNAAMYKGELNQLKLYLLQYGAEVEVTPQPFDDFALVHTSIVGGAEIEVDGKRLEVTEGKTALIAPRKKVRLRWYPGSQQLIVKIPHALLREVSARADGDIGLAPCFLVERELASQWDHITRSLVNVMSMSREGAFHTAWLDHFERNAALFLLAHQGLEALVPPAANASNPSAPPVEPVGRHRLEALDAYIDSRLGAPIALEDLARTARVSVRRLNELCHRHHGVTPMELLRNRRLDAARARLRMQPNASITQTAFDVGFGHLGRFSQYYFERFGELPRQTQTQA